MVLSVLSSIAYLLVMILLVTIGAALLLGIGTVLTFLFAVSVWEATVVVMAVTAGAVWLFPSKPGHDLGYKYGLLRWQNDVAGGPWRAS